MRKVPQKYFFSGMELVHPWQVVAQACAGSSSKSHWLQPETRSHKSIFEPRRRSLVISPYGTMAAVEGANSVISVPMYDCSARIAVVGGLCGKFWSGLCHSPKWYPTNPDRVLYSLQNPGYSREVAAFDKPATTEVSHLVGS